MQGSGKYISSLPESPRYNDTHKTYCLIYCPNLLCGFTSLPLIVIRRYLMRMLIHSKIPYLHCPSGSLASENLCT
nr:MAG TPA: hypothetical protein [Bacteriophage sp.]